MTACYRGLDLTFTATATDAAVDGRLAQLFAACAADADPEVALTICGDGSSPYRVLVDGAGVATTARADDAVAHLVWEVNRMAVERCAAQVVVHAGAVAWGGVGVLLAGPSGSGKSTLTAALVAGGCAYLTDEAVAIDARDARARPYPKPIALPAVSYEALRRAHVQLDLARYAPCTTGEGERGEALVPVGALGGVVAGSCRPELVVVLRRASSPAPRLHPASRADTLVALAQQTFAFDRGGDAGFDLLARLVTEADCFALDVGDAVAAAPLVLAAARARHASADVSSP